jgi:hypothetical protein
MSIRTRILPAVPFLLAGLWLAPCASAAETSPVQCAANDDRVWVYDSLATFSVELRLKCGEPVEVLGRVKGYVKVRTSGGKEGYVPDAALPNLPAFVDPQAIPADGLASLVRSRKAAASQPAVASAPAAAPASPASSASAKKPSEPEATAVMTIEPVPASPARPSPANVKPVSVAPKKTLKPAPAPAKKATPTPPPAPVVTTSVASITPPSNGRTGAQKPAESASTQSVYLSSIPANTSPRIESAVEKNPVLVVSTAGMKQPVAASMRSVAAVTDSEDDPESKPEDQSADPACQVFFSAYGLSPAQYRWIAQNRQKKYPGICPAANPSQVDFVMIFTHDVDIFNGTLPDPVHVDKNGFSDFSPLTMVDSALMPEVAADKARHQLVWVFRMKRGAFDPAKFSPRRHPQFTKVEASSHATDRTTEDAFEFIEGAGSTR